MNFLLSPITLFWLLLLCAFGCYKFKKNSKAKIFFSIAIIQLFMFSATPLPALMVASLEQKFPSTFSLEEIEKKDIPILILGGGYVNDSNLSSLNQLSEAALGRLVQGVYLYRSFPNRKFICSGYSQSNQRTIAEVMARNAIIMGINPKDTLMLPNSSSTWNEAIDFKKRFGSAKQFFLVTSAIHMPRAMENFKRIGLKPIASPTNFLVKEDKDKNVYSWKPSSIKIAMTEKALHEYVGLWYYRIFKKE